MSLAHRVYLVRHPSLVEEQAPSAFLGRTDWLADVNSALCLSNALVELKVETLVSSPLQRCARLAKDLAEQTDLPLEFDANWQERDWGVWDGCAVTDIDAHALQAYYDAPFDYSIDQAETVVAMQTRINQAWLDLVALRQDVLCITHGGPMRLVLRQVLGLSNSALFQLKIDYGTLIGFDVYPSEQGVFAQLCLIQPLLSDKVKG